MVMWAIAFAGLVGYAAFEIGSIGHVQGVILIALAIAVGFAGFPYGFAGRWLWPQS